MYEQKHAFCDQGQTRFALTTMAKVAVDGAPVDFETDQTCEYFGPVIWVARHYSVAIDPDTHRLAIIAPDGTAHLLNCNRKLKTARHAPSRPLLGVALEGGLVQAVVSDEPEWFADTRVLIIDHDVEGAAASELQRLHDREGKPHEPVAVQMSRVEEAWIDLPTLASAIEKPAAPSIDSRHAREALSGLRQQTLAAVAAQLRKLPEQRLDLDEADDAVELADFGDPEEHNPHIRTIGLESATDRLQATVFYPVDVNEQTWDATELDEHLSAENTARLLAAVERVIASSSQ